MYKYKILQADALINEEQLNKEAANGWRLVTIVNKDNIFYFYFEKEEKVGLKSIN